jgi:DNA-binding LytR/AlgR family response regulator
MLHPHLSAIFRKKVALPCRQGHHFFVIADILYFKADNKEAVVVMKDSEGGGVCTEVRVFRSLKELESALSASGFLRIRRDILVNTLNIKSYSKEHTIVLCSDVVLHPSRDKVRMVEAYLKKFFYV